MNAKVLQAFDMPGRLYRVFVYKRKVKIRGNIHRLPVTLKEVLAMLARLKRLEYKYPDMAWFCCVSTTDGRTAVKKVVRTGGVGRPVLRVFGKKKPLHVHIGITSKYAHKIANEFKVKTNRAFGAKRVRHSVCENAIHAKAYAEYSYRQADNWRQGGTYKFFA